METKACETDVYHRAGWFRGLDGMNVDNIKHQVDRLVFPDVHRVIILVSRFLHEHSSGAASFVEVLE